MGQTGPSEGFLERVFGPKKRKRTEDINLPSKREQNAADKSEAEEYRRKKKATSDSGNGGGGILSRAKAAKEKYNPFDAYVRATGGKTSN